VKFTQYFQMRTIKPQHLAAYLDNAQARLVSLRDLQSATGEELASGIDQFAHQLHRLAEGGVKIVGGK
jgi:hypothetical protein